MSRNPAAPKKGGILGKTATSGSAQHKALHRGDKHEPQKQNREGLKKAKIELEFRRIKKELDPYSQLFAISDEAYNRFLRECYNSDRYDEEQGGFIFTPAISSGGKGSKKLQFLLLIMGLAMVSQSVASDPRINIDELFAQFTDSLSNAAKATKKTFEQVVDSGMEYFQALAKYDPIPEAAQYVAANIALPVFMRAKSRGKAASIGDIAFSVISTAASTAAVPTGEKNKISGEELIKFFLNTINYGDLESVRKSLQSAKKSGKLKSLLTSVPPISKVNTFVLAANKGKTDMIKVMIEAIKDDAELLKEMLTTNSVDGASSFYTACYHGHVEIVKLMLEVAGKHKDILKEMLLTVEDQHKMSAFYSAVDKGSLEMVKLIIESAKPYPEILKEMLLTQYTVNKLFPLETVITLSNTEIIKLIIESAKPYPEILKEILTKHGDSNFQGNIVYRSAFVGQSKQVTAMIEAVKDNPDLLGSLVKEKNPAKGYLDTMSYLLISGEWPAMQMILERYTKIKIEALPISYFCKIPQSAIYYLDVFTKDSSFSYLPKDKPQISYHQLQKDKFKEVSIEEISIIPDSPILIKLKSGGKIEKVMLGSDIVIEKNEDPEKFVQGIESSSVKIKTMMNLAQKHSVKNIVVNYDSHAYEHAMTFNFIKNQDWQVVFYDPNGFVSPQTQQEISLLLGGSTLGIAEVFTADVIIPNHGSSISIEGGNCDMISSMVSAAIIAGQDYMDGLTRFCKEVGPSCVEILGKQMNPKVDKIMERRLDKVKEKMKPSQSILSPKIEQKESKVKQEL